MSFNIVPPTFVKLWFISPVLDADSGSQQIGDCSTQEISKALQAGTKI
jgi:hypothetical protein